ncbi:acyltransferase [Microbacterium invictum]|uniref:Acyltransferase n=1 Tax=Microbacterium invictum TaxID=515415 RepID=A0ABZ0V856_9MICO|nr:acyltransferase [Microbacterium invictum]WQB69803.1 acyltransferase [Microbacterium invictum]
MPRNPDSFSSVFDPRANGLNFVRLFLAAGVILWHSFPLTGAEIDLLPLRQLLAEVWVDGFFAISGFLILGSWMRDPHAGRYLRARILRILPAFWVCLLVTAFIVAPLATMTFGMGNLTYVVKNAVLWVFQYGIDGTPAGVPFPGVWNGSIWTLAWEFLCYLLILALGVTGALRHPPVVPVLFIICVLGIAFTSLAPVEIWLVETAARFGSMFLAGALIWQLQDRIRCNRNFVMLSILLVVGSLWLPDYRLLASLPLAYLMLVIGAVIKTPRLRLRNDISYGVYIYAFPIQQVLALAGVWTLGVPGFASLALAITVPVAAASWFLIEKPVLRYKNQSLRRAPASGDGSEVREH